MDDIVIIFILILLNGVFSMSEVALISARKSRLAAEAKTGNRSAATALELQNEPDRFLSTVQIGITLIGILTGMYSGATIATELGQRLTAAGLQPTYAIGISKALIITIVTYLSIVVGELVPKRIGLSRADSAAKIVARPMRILSYITYPAVWLLSVSTSAAVKLLHIGENRSKVTEEEIKSLIQEGTDAGEVKEVEQDIMERALVMGDCRIDSIMTPRKEVAALSVGMDEDDIRRVLSEELHSSYPVYDNRREDICGVVSLKRLVLSLGTAGFEITDQITDALSLPDTMTVYDALESLKRTKEHSALVYDEYGVFQGIVTLRDILEGLVGNISGENEGPAIIKRNDREEWSVAGQCPVYEFLAHFDRCDLYAPASYSTMGGLIMELIRKVPVKGDSIAWHGFNLKVIHMDRARVARILVTMDTEQPESSAL